MKKNNFYALKLTSFTDFGTICKTFESWEEAEKWFREYNGDDEENGEKEEKSMSERIRTFIRENGDAMDSETRRLLERAADQAGIAERRSGN